MNQVKSSPSGAVLGEPAGWMRQEKCQGGGESAAD